MLIIIWILLIACGILFPRSKILLWFMLSFMIVSIGCRTQGADYISYSLEFQWAATQKLTDVSYPGFVLVAKIAHQYGLSFESFVFTVATFSCVLFYIGIKRLTSNENLLMALFFIYPFSHELIQMRTFLADSIIISILPGILNCTHQLKDKIIKTVILVLIGSIATSFHFEVIFSILFLIITLWVPQKIEKKCVPLVTIILFMLAICNVFPKLFGRTNPMAAQWLSARTGFGIVTPIFITLLILYLNHIASTRLYRVETNDTKRCFYSNCNRFGLCGALLIPFFTYDITFNRVWRILLVVLYSMLSDVSKEKMSKKSWLTYIILTAFLLLGLFVYENSFSIIYEAFKNNSIFGFLSVVG